MSLAAPSLPTTAVARLKAALAEFARAWKRRRPAVRSMDKRHFGAAATLIICGAVVATAIYADEPVLNWARGLSLPVIHVFEKITRLGESGYVFALSVLAGVIAVLLRGEGRARVEAGLTLLAARAMFLFDVVAVSGIASQVLKHVFGRARPKLHLQLPDMVGLYHFDVLSIYASYASFPSGHAVTAFAMATAIAFLTPRLGAPLFLLAVLVGLSRVVILAHYASDVVAGAALGVGSAFIVRRAFAARGIVFKQTAHGARPRGRGLIWPALRARLRGV